MSISTRTEAYRLRGPVPNGIEETSESPLQPSLGGLGRFGRLFAKVLCSCTHDQLVLDDINDIRCSGCGRDFTD